MKDNKAILPIAVIMASVILGGFFYAIQINKQRSIERQQQIKLTDDKRIEEVRLAQEKKEYVAKRRSECYDIEQRERITFNNVVDHFYREEDDVCFVHYKTDDYNGYTKEECREEFGMTPEGLDCELGQFSKRY